MTVVGVRTWLVVSVLCFAASACASGVDTPDRPPTSEGGRAQDTPILGVQASPAAPLPECVESVVSRNKKVPVAEFTIKGQASDDFSYEILKRDGSLVRGSSGEFGPGQRDVFMVTGVPHEDIKLVTVTATGRVGIPGSCVITTIR